MKKSDKIDVKPNDLALLDFFEEDVRLVSSTFGLSLYTDRLLSEIPDAILYSYEKFLELVPKENLKFYATENMKRHKPVTERVFNMLKTWFKPDTLPRKYVVLELKDGNIYQDAPKFKFKISGSEKGSVGYEGESANVLSCSFPPSWGVDKIDEMLGFIAALCDHFPFQSGHAGFSFECSRYEQEISQTYAWQKSMYHPGIDVSRIPEDSHAVGQDALKTVAWLTLVNMNFIDKLGGIKALKKKLPKKIELIETPYGYIFKAGDRPTIGNRNRGDSLPMYQGVYDVLAPLIKTASERSLAFDIADDFVEKTERWYTRFENE